MDACDTTTTTAVESPSCGAQPLPSSHSSCSSPSPSLSYSTSSSSSSKPCDSPLCWPSPVALSSERSCSVASEPSAVARLENCNDRDKRMRASSRRDQCHTSPHNGPSPCRDRDCPTAPFPSCERRSHPQSRRLLFDLPPGDAGALLVSPLIPVATDAEGCTHRSPLPRHVPCSRGASDGSGFDAKKVCTSTHSGVDASYHRSADSFVLKADSTFDVAATQRRVRWWITCPCCCCFCGG
ncbi:hypothetical protein DFJ73DRAFT_212564 [Zopfochytrium polystomum]|nr:hypothetical protein DFJ73DRAFT_212564 [Zopfochytrium polystomum]